MARAIFRSASPVAEPGGFWPRALTYGAAAGAAAAALGLAVTIRYATQNPTAFPFYAAIFVSVWFLGTGPGWFATALVAGMAAFTRPRIGDALLPPDAMEVLPTLVNFLVCMLLSQWLSGRRQRSEAALRAARDGLEWTVEERTAQLRAANASLTAEIEERKRVEAALRASEEWWRAIFETSNVPMGVTDLQGRHVMYNQASERLLGYSSEELKSVSIIELTHEDDRAHSLPLFAELARGERKGYHVIKRYRCKDGSVKWLNASVARVPDPKGGADLAVSIVADVTEQKRVEEELRRNEAQWRSFFEQAPVGIGLRSSDGRPLAMNPAFQALVGYTFEELGSRTFEDITHPDDLPVHRRHLALVEAGETTRFEKRYVCKDGRTVWVSMTFSEFSGTESMPPGYIAVIQDITERKRTEDALRQSQAELARVARLTTMGELTASIAHEINQPLAAIVASGNACQRWLANGHNLPRAVDSLNRMISDANRAGEIIKRIRSHTQKRAPEEALLDVETVIDDVLAIAQGELRTRGVLLERKASPSLPRVMGDRVQLQQVLLNLVMNGIEAMADVHDRQRVLAIETRSADDGHLEVSVRDSGTGLDPAHRERIFETFFTTKSGGMGMGLSISRSIVEAHGGRLWGSSAGPFGAVFALALPAACGAER